LFQTLNEILAEKLFLLENVQISGIRAQTDYRPMW